MICHILFSGKNKEIIICCLQNVLPSMLGPVVQSIISLTSLLVVKMLTVLVSTISNSQVY